MLYGKNGEKLYDPRFWFTEARLGTKVKLTALVDDGKNAPYKAYLAKVVSPEFICLFGPTIYGSVCNDLLRDLMKMELTPPYKCECQSREWLETHPGDKQEYWRTADGRAYAKDHTDLCPKNPKNRSKND